MRKILVILQNIALIFGCIAFLFSWIEPLYSEITRKNIYEGVPEKFCKSGLPFVGEITSFAVAGNTLYVLFDMSQELRCYSLNGDYLCSYRYATHQNGRAELHSNATFLYLDDREHNFYVFQNGEFIEYLDATVDVQRINNVKIQFDNKDKQISTEEGVRFYVKRASLWKELNSTSEEVLHRPPWTLLFYRKNLLVITLASACVVLLLKWIIARRTGA